MNGEAHVIGNVWVTDAAYVLDEAGYGRRPSEERDDLVKEVRAEVVELPRSWEVRILPGVLQFHAVAIVAIAIQIQEPNQY